MKVKKCLIHIFKSNLGFVFIIQTHAKINSSFCNQLYYFKPVIKQGVTKIFQDFSFELSTIFIANDSLALPRKQVQLKLMKDLICSRPPFFMFHHRFIQPLTIHVKITRVEIR